MLSGKRVLLLRPEAQDVSDDGRPSRAAFETRGAEVTQIALAVLMPPHDAERVREARRAVQKGDYDWLVFTSVHGVARFVREELSAEALSRVRIACVGPSTAEALVRLGRSPDLVAPEARTHGAGLAEALNERLGEGKARILLARAEVAREELPKRLRTAGHAVDDVAVYRSELAKDRATELGAWLERAKEHAGAIVVFSSPSSVDAFLELSALSPEPRQDGHQRSALLFASIGPVTTARCKDRGLQVAVEAKPSTFSALAEALDGL